MPRTKSLFYSSLHLFIIVSTSSVFALDTQKRPENDLAKSFTAEITKKKKIKTTQIIENPNDASQYFVIEPDFKRRKLKHQKPHYELVVVDDKKFSVTNEDGQSIRMGVEDKSGNVWSTATRRNIAQDQNAFDPQELHDINGAIAEVRHNLYQNFHRTFVQTPGGKFKCNSVQKTAEGDYVKIDQPEGIYTKYLDMRDLTKSQIEFLNDVSVDRLKLVDLFLTAGTLLNQVQPHLNMGAFAKRIYSRRVKEFEDTTKLFENDGSEFLSFNDFLRQLEIADLFLENVRQVFQAVLSLETIEVSKPQKAETVFPIKMRSGLDVAS